MTSATVVEVESGAAESNIATEGATDAACQNCGEPFLGDYCHGCGEKRPGARDLSLRHFAAEATQELTSVEHSKIFRTIFALLFRPGLLTLEWIAGRRSRYLKPLNLCLGALALNLFAYTALKQVTTFDVKLILDNERESAARMNIEKGGAFQRLVERASTRKNLSPEEIHERINERWQRYVSLFQIPQILLLALLLQVVYLFSRRYFVEHLVFAMHFMAFTSLTVTLMWPIYYFMGLNPTRLNMFVAVGKFSLDILYLFVSLRAVYKGTVVGGLLRAFVVFGGYFLIYVVTYVTALFGALMAVFRS